MLLFNFSPAKTFEDVYAVEEYINNNRKKGYVAFRSCRTHHTTSRAVHIDKNTIVYAPKEFFHTYVTKRMKKSREDFCDYKQSLFKKNYPPTEKYVCGYWDVVNSCSNAS